MIYGTNTAVLVYFYFTCHFDNAKFGSSGRLLFNTSAKIRRLITSGQQSLKIDQPLINFSHFVKKLAYSTTDQALIQTSEAGRLPATLVSSCLVRFFSCPPAGP